jgi:FKBP-type peptidyl-prolyl cis-trans isomerase FklB
MARDQRLHSLLIPALAAVMIGATSERPAEDPTARASYSLGHQIGSDLASQGKAIDADSLRQGLLDALAARSPALARPDMDELLVDLKRKIVDGDQPGLVRRKKASEQRHRGAAFLATNALEPDVVTRESGLQYRVVTPGNGRLPSADDRVSLRYRSSLIDGNAFHDSLRESEKPETLHVGGVVKGLTEALQLMREGARWQVVVPADLAYGSRGPIADRTVIFDVELISIVDPRPLAAEGSR